MAGLLPDSEIRAARAVADSALPDWVTIQTATLADDGGGDHVATWADARRVRARIARPTTGQRILQTEQVLRDAVVDAVDWIVTLPHDDPVTTRERIVTDDGRTLLIVATDRARSYQLHVRVLAIEAR